MVEVLLEGKAKHVAQPDGHIAIAREVVIDLHEVGEGGRPGTSDGEVRGMAKQPVSGRCHDIGDQDLLCQAAAEATQAQGNLVRARLAPRDLQLDVVVLDDGARHQLREERDV